MDDKEKQSRESEKQNLSLKKDIEHLDYRTTEQDKETEFLKTHISSKHKEQSGKWEVTNEKNATAIAVSKMAGKNLKKAQVIKK